MRKAVLLLLSLLVCSLHAFAATRVKDFDCSVLLDNDGAAVVNETITLAPGESQFIRTIPLHTPGHEDAPVIVRVLKVEDGSGTALEWDKSRSFGHLLIGIAPRTRLVRLTFLVRNAVRFAGDHDELIWPATDQDFVLERAEIRVALPKAAEGQFSAHAFTTTPDGVSTKPVWSSTGALPVEVQPLDVRTGSPGPLPAGTVITLGVFLHKGPLAEPNALTRASWYLGTNRIVFLPLAAFAIMLVVRRVRPPVPRRSIAACYEPPAGLSPAEVGTIVDDHVDPRDVAATLADLAVRGFLRFDLIAAGPDDAHSEADFKITLVRPKEQWDGLAPHEYTMLFHTFYGGHWTQLSSLRLRFPDIVPLFRDDVMAALRAQGLYTSLRWSPWIVCQIGFWAVAALLFIATLTGVVSFYESPWTALVSIIGSAIVVLATGGKLSNKTRRGQRVWADVRGFQEFLDRVDADRMQRLTADLYEKYLPYAMALGVEHGWTAAFDGIAVPVPDWFGADGGITDPSKFHDSLHAFIEHTLHQIESAHAPRAKLRVRGAGAN